MSKFDKTDFTSNAAELYTAMSQKAQSMGMTALEFTLALHYITDGAEFLSNLQKFDRFTSGNA